MSNERIDLTQFKGMEEWEVEKRPDCGYAIKTGRDNFSLEEAETIAKLPTLIAELKRCYDAIDGLTWRHMQVLRERKDLRDSGLSMAKKADFQGNRIESLIDALRIIRDDLNEAIAQGHLPITSTHGIDVTKIRNFANDATQ